MNDQIEYDYLIVGSGAAGSVLAERLSTDPSVSVLVLEAGPGDANPVHLIPKGFYFTMMNPRYTKVFRTTAGNGVGEERWQRGRVVGGSTTLNGSVWNRGTPRDYEEFELLGGETWGWSSFLRAFRDIEDHQLGANTSRGAGGPVSVSVAGPRERVNDAFLEAAGDLGINTVEDFNEPEGDRASYVPSSARRGLRMSAARAFLRRAARRKNVTVRSRCEVRRVIFDGTTATGAEYSHNGRDVTVRVRREVILAAGALDTPLLLERSGVGNPDVLAAAGVDCVVANPRIGENLLEHRGIRMQFRLRERLGYNHLIRGLFARAVTGIKYLLRRDGVLSFGGYSVIANHASSPGATSPDTQTLFTPISTGGSSPAGASLAVDSGPGAMLLTNPLFPRSAGSIHITGPAPEDPPRIDANYFDDPHDREVMIAAFRMARRLVETSPLKELIVDEITPTGTLVADDEIIEYARANGANSYHTLGTCAVESVVDRELRVKGAQGLRVVDASVFPSMPSGNNSAPTQALAYLAAEQILASAAQTALRSDSERTSR